MNLNKSEPLVGYYCWAGPGTIRMLQTKYFDPQIDFTSLLSSYDEPYLAQIKQKLGVTDFWATYSWGFNPRTERVDHHFLLDRVANFKQHDVRLHAYLQGTNLVTNEFPNQDLWARDSFGRYLSYHRGRRLTCVNNPHLQQHFYQVVTEALNHDFDGIYIDNVNMGQMVPPIAGAPLFFVGCRCQYCLTLFKKQTGLTIPRILVGQPAEVVEQYLHFRASSLHAFLRQAAQLAHQRGKLFGSNSFDPKFDPKTTYGYEYDQLATFQDYLLFETHSFPLPNGVTQNRQADAWAMKLKVPVFALSYKKGISYDPGLTQQEIELLQADAASHHFNLCYKGSEFVTKGVWHNLDITKIKRSALPKRQTRNENRMMVQDRKVKKSNQLRQKSSQQLFTILLATPVVALLANYLFGWFTYLIMEKKRVRPLMKVVYQKVVS